MPTYRIIEETETNFVVLWDEVLLTNHHKSDSADAIERLIAEYPKEDAVRQQAIIDAGFMTVPFIPETAQEPVTFQEVPNVLANTFDTEVVI